MEHNTPSQANSYSDGQEMSRPLQNKRYGTCLIRQQTKRRCGLCINTLSAALTNKSWNKTDKVLLQVYTFGLVSGYISIYGKNVVDEMTKNTKVDKCLASLVPYHRDCML
jgi:hypothetical protein